jgi:hypothetical protein
MKIELQILLVVTIHYGGSDEINAYGSKRETHKSSHAKVLISLSVQEITYFQYSVLFLDQLEWSLNF